MRHLTLPLALAVLVGQTVNDGSARRAGGVTERD